MKTPLFYSLKVWLSSVFLAPASYTIIASCFKQQRSFFDSAIEIYVMMVLIGGVLSFFTWLLFWVIAEVTAKFLKNMAERKFVLFIAGLILTISTFLLILPPANSFSFNDMSFDMMLCNCLCIGAGSLFYSFEPQKIAP